MVDYSLIQTRIDHGYAKAASVLGPFYQQVRATGPDNPMATPLANLNAWITTDPMLKGGMPLTFGKPQCFAAIERDNLQVGDYLVGQLGTFFITSIDYPSPVALIYCNRSISIARAQDTLKPGANTQRFGTSIQTAQPFMTGWPASVLQMSSGSKMASTGMNLPTDSKVPAMTVLLPTTTPVIRFNDLITDDAGQRYMIASTEFSTLGWRLTSELQPAG